MRTRRFSASLSAAFGLALASYLHKPAVSADQIFPLTVARDAAVPEFCRSTYLPVSAQTCGEGLCADSCGELTSTPTFCESLMTRPTLLGDWLGSRTHLAESGYNFSVSTTQYFQGFPSPVEGPKADCCWVLAIVRSRWELTTKVPSTWP